MLAHVFDHREPEVGEWAEGERCCGLGQPHDQISIVQGTIAVVDARDLQEVECLAHVIRGSFLPGVGHADQALAARSFENPREL